MSRNETKEKWLSSSFIRKDNLNSNVSTINHTKSHPSFISNVVFWIIVILCPLLW